MQFYTALIALYVHNSLWSSIQPLKFIQPLKLYLKLYTASKVLYSLWSSVQHLKLYTASKALYSLWSSVQPIKLYAASKALYFFWSSVQPLKFCTASKSLYTVQPLELYTASTVLGALQWRHSNFTYQELVRCGSCIWKSCRTYLLSELLIFWAVSFKFLF